MAGDMWSTPSGTRVCVGTLAAVVLMATLAPAVAPHDPLAVHTDQILAPPSWTFPAGTDHLGRCLLSRTLYGASRSLGSAMLVTILVLVIGTAVGVTAGLGGTIVDTLLMRVVDTFLSFPALLLALAALGLFGPGLTQALAAFTAVLWARYARLVRSLVVRLREDDYILAARSAGATRWHITRRHLLPVVAEALLVVAATDFGDILLVLSAVSFLGLGVPPPTPELGSLLNDARAYVLSVPRLTLVPGLWLVFAVMSVNLASDGLRDGWRLP